MTRALAGLYMALVTVLLAAAVGAWRLRCEGFGCMGVGVAWFAWVCAFAVVLAIGIWARARVAAGSGLGRACMAAWWLQLSLGLGLMLAWATRNVV